jgi:hypothetical protein
MMIKRRATGRNVGPGTIELDNLSFEWDGKQECIVATQQSTRGDFSTSLRKYHFCVNISLEEFSQMLESVGNEAALRCPENVSGALAKNLRPIIRIANVCSGVKLTS